MPIMGKLHLITLSVLIRPLMKLGTRDNLFRTQDQQAAIMCRQDSKDK
jgi:hypothetical protein